MAARLNTDVPTKVNKFPKYRTRASYTHDEKTEKYSSEMKYNQDEQKKI